MYHFLGWRPLADLLDNSLGCLELIGAFLLVFKYFRREKEIKGILPSRGCGFIASFNILKN